VPFIGQRGGSGEVTSGGRACHSQVKGREREVSSSVLKLRVTYKACWRIRISRDALIKREASEGDDGKIPRFSCQV
jgi:hypothetical protein